MPQLLKKWVRAQPAREGQPRTDIRDDSGQSLIEMALVLPVFFLMMFGLINFCLVMFGLCNLSFASRTAMRYACMHSSTSLLPTTQATIDGIVAPYIFKYPSNTYSDTLTYTNGNVVGGTAKVAVSVTYKIVLPLYTYQALTLSSTASGMIVQ